jgi:phosphatidylglycerol:prolipoprotein diacylglycerol transferase
VFPTLFHIGPIEVKAYGTLLMLGFIAGILLARRQARLLGLSPDLPLDLGIWVLLSGIVFARLLYVALNWQDYAWRPLLALEIWREGGLSFHGGLLGGVLAGVLFSRSRRVPFLTLADMVAPGLPLAYGIARFGCFLNGCCYGAPTSAPWGVCFPVSPGSPLATHPSHPTQIYSALGSFAILGLLLWARPRLPVRGQLFFLYLAAYSVVRAIVEVFRAGYTAQFLIGPLTQAQVASAVIFIGAVVALVWLHRRGRRTAGPTQNQPSE